jgi:hypothetical protein
MLVHWQRLSPLSAHPLLRASLASISPLQYRALAPSAYEHVFYILLLIAVRIYSEIDLSQDQ